MDGNTHDKGIGCLRGHIQASQHGLSGTLPQAILLGVVAKILIFRMLCTSNPTQIELSLAYPIHPHKIMFNELIKTLNVVRFIAFISVQKVKMPRQAMMVGK